MLPGVGSDRKRRLAAHAVTLGITSAAFGCGLILADIGNDDATVVQPIPSDQPQGVSEPAHRASTPDPTTKASPVVGSPSSAGQESGATARGSQAPSPKELLRAASRVASLQAAIESVRPREELWPDPVPPDLVPEAFERRVLDAIDSVGAGQLQALACDEYPCVATLGFAGGDTPRLERFKQLMDVRQEVVNRLGMPVDAHMDHQDGEVWLTLAAHPGEIGTPRLRQRLKEQWNAARP